MLETTVQNFHILEHLGGGAMGLVYKARDLRDDRTVALKFLPYELKEDPESRERFLREAHAASNLQHPNICTIVETGEATDGRLFVALDYFEGETLKKILERGPLPVDEALRITRRVAAGLAAAHGQGLIHQDLVPANILVTADGEVKILDFGLSKHVSRGGLTQVGWSLGTPEYMAPEQIRGDDAETTTDLWSLGVILYEMVVGENPFAGRNLAEVLTAIQKRTPKPISASQPDVPEALDAIVTLLLAKDPVERYLSCGELLADLGADGEAPRAPETTPTSSAHISLEHLRKARAVTAGPSRDQPVTEEAEDVTDIESGGLPWPIVVSVVLLLVVLALLVLL